jgi:peptide/nickel transport system ATP-binding protein
VALGRPADAASSDAVGDLLSVEGLRTHFGTYRGTVRALSGVDLAVRPGEILGLVGETGSGKSVTGLSILRLIGPPGRIVAGRVMFRGTDLLSLPEQEMRSIRGAAISMIFQSPRRCLNPVFSIGYQMALILRRHRGLKGRRAVEEIKSLLTQVGLRDPHRIIRAYPTELSTGMCQRVMISMALSCEPDLLIADEPTTGLDVTLQAQILELVRRRVREVGSSCLLITHDLGVVAENCDRVVVMYGGRVVEQGTTAEVFASPTHPYTAGLLASTLRIDIPKPLHIIRGTVPDLINMPDLCAFLPRCDRVADVCRERDPAMNEIAAGHPVRCHLVGG